MNLIRKATQAIKSRPIVIVGLVIVVVVVAAAVLAPLLAPHDPYAVDPPNRFLPPAWEEGGASTNPLGTDQLGRDLLSRIVYGARSSLAIAGGAALIAGTAGSLLGLISGYRGRWLDTVLMRVADVQLAFPLILLALAILSITQQKTVVSVMLVLAVADWVIYARTIRSRVLVEKEEDYVRAARALGSSHSRVMFRYILPSVLPSLIVLLLLQLAVLMVVESVLAFVGLGIDPPLISWGSILADGRRNIAVASWMLIFPGLAIFVSVLGVNLVADGLADVLDPRLKLGGSRKVSRKQAPISASTSESNNALPSSDSLLSVSRLTVTFPGEPPVVAVKNVTFEVGEGQRIGIVGESGSGKTVTGLTILKLADPSASIRSGSIRYKGQELVSASARTLGRVRGREIAMIFQDPGSSLNPTLKVGWQISEALRLHRGLSRRAAKEEVPRLLDLVNIHDANRVAQSYPFELSGGMQQRIMIAMAIAGRPRCLIADEPTTALDVTTQAQILFELDELVANLNMSVVLISHDLGVVAGFTDHVLVMYAGEIVESGPTGQVVAHPKHPYTQTLLASVLALEDRDQNRASGVQTDSHAAMPPATGCPFASRCPRVMDVCITSHPTAVSVGDGSQVACHQYVGEGVGT